MSTQQDIYAAGSENRPPMLNKENYVPWSSRLLRYAKSRPNGKLIYNSIMNGPYVRRMIPEPGDADREVPVPETFHEQTDDELTVAEIKQMEADDQAIQTILLGLPEDIYAAVDSCETAQEIWLRVQQMMKGSDIGIQEKKAKLFNEWERFTSTDGESIESYYHRFSKLMNDFKRNKHFPEKIASNLKFLNNLQPEWSRHVTIVHQTKDLHTTDYTQLYDFLKYNQKELSSVSPRSTITKYLHATTTTQQQQLSPTATIQPELHATTNAKSQRHYRSHNRNDMALVLMAKEFKLNYSTPTNNNQRISSNPRNRQIAQPGMNMGQDRQMQMVGGNGGNQFRQYVGQNVGNQNGYNAVQNVGNQNPNGNGNVVAAQAEGNAIRNNEAGIQLQAKEFDLMAVVADLDEIEEVNANCILMANLQQVSTSGTQTNKAPVYDLDGSVEFLGTIRFGNDHVATIMGFGDLQWGNILITRVYFVEGLGHNLLPVGQFCDSDLENHCPLQSPVIIIRTDNGTEFKNQILKEYFDSVGISHQASFVRTPQQNGVVERRNRTLVEAARTMLIFSRAPKPDISFLHVFGALCYPKNDRENIWKLGAKGDIGFFIGYSTDSRAYIVYNRRTKKIMETMNVTFDELSAMYFKQSSSKSELQSMTSGHISSGLDLTYAPSTITTQQPTEGELDLLFEAMHDDHIGGQLPAALRTVLAAQAPQVLQTPTTTITTTDTAPTPINSSSQATNFPNTSQDVDELKTQQQHV
ncbi:retrovirus-related pol polyprotein from transposon TNT 1-94 [Tanacetum coccineum]